MQEQAKVHKEQIKSANLEFKLKRAQKTLNWPVDPQILVLGEVQQLSCGCKNLKNQHINLRCRIQRFVGNGCVERIQVYVDDNGVGNLWHYEARVIAQVQEFQKGGVASL